MSSIFCCTSVAPYKNRRLDHESKFDSFMSWAKTAGTVSSLDSSDIDAPYAVQFVRQVNYGPIESKQYFVPSSSGDLFNEIDEGHLIRANFKKLNTFKNFTCGMHNKSFEVNIYQKDPVNKHHWRADVDRPANSIDL